MSMQWWLFFHLLGATFGVGFVFFQILLAARVKRLKGTPDEGALMKAHLMISRMGSVFLLTLLVTGVAMWGMNDYKSMGRSMGWLHAKAFNVVLLYGLFFFVSVPNGKKVGLALSQPGSVVTDEVRSAYRKAVMAGHTAMLLILINVILGYWKPGY